MNHTLDAPRVVVPLHIDPHAVPALGAAVHRLHGLTMGTTWTVKLAAAPALDTTPLQRRIQHVLDRVVAQMSTWDAASDLCRFNRAAPLTWQVLPPQFAQVLDAALQVAAASDGAFDPAAGRLVDAWGFGPGAPHHAHGRHDQPGFRPPSAAAVEAARAGPGWRDLRLDRAGARALQPGGAALDFSAIAKGFGVDEVARCLRDVGIAHFLAEVGGELCGQGVRPDGQPWWVDVEAPPADDPAATPPTLTRVALHGLCIATSGDYRRWFRHAGRRHPHTIDPRSGAPVRHGLASVSVLHASCMLADAWSTALTVLGPEDGPRLAAAQGLAALFVTRRDGGFTETLTPALAEMAR